MMMMIKIEFGSQYYTLGSVLTKCSACVNLFNPYHNSLSYVPLLSLPHTQGSWGPKRLSNLPPVTHLEVQS